MTLILSRISYRYALQVSDRLVSNAGRPVDPAANKTLVLISRGGVAAISYTGLAVINSMPTDQWLAQVLTGVTYPSGIKPPMFSCGVPIATRSFHEVAARLQRALSEAFRAPAQVAVRRSYFDIMITGWQWGRHSRPRAINISIERLQGSEIFTVSRSPRHLARRYICFLTPQGNVHLIDADESKKRISAARTDNEAQQAFIWAIRNAAAYSTVVGPHCMSILIPHPNTGGATVSYHGTPAGVAVVSNSTGARVASVVADYTPWIIGLNSVWAPSIVNGDTTISTAGYEVSIKAIHGTSGFPQISSAQDRPRL